MPSPLGHALAGISVGYSVTRPGQGSGAVTARRTTLLAVFGMLADVDLLFGSHSGPTHGIGAAAMVGVMIWIVARAMHLPSAARWSLACGLAYASHTLLDWLGTDSSPPIGIMALWPFSKRYYESSLHIFMAVSRRFNQGHLFWTHNLQALARELLIMVPVCALVFIVNRGRAAKLRAEGV